MRYLHGMYILPTWHVNIVTYVSCTYYLHGMYMRKIVLIITSLLYLYCRGKYDGFEDNSDDDDIDLVDLTEDPKKCPGVDTVGACIGRELHNKKWEDCIVVKSRKNNSPTRKAWTAFLNQVCQLPHLEQFALTEKLSTAMKTAKNNACISVSQNVYISLWHAGMIFPGIQVKKKGNDKQIPPNPLSNTFVMSAIVTQIKLGIRAVANSRRRTERVRSRCTYYIHITYM